MKKTLIGRTEPMEETVKNEGGISDGQKIKS